MNLSRARATAGRLRSIRDSSYITKGEWAERTVPGGIVFAVACAGLLQIDGAVRTSSRKRHIYGPLLCVDACDTEIEHQCHRCYVFHRFLLSFGGDHFHELVPLLLVQAQADGKTGHGCDNYYVSRRTV